MMNLKESINLIKGCIELEEHMMESMHDQAQLNFYKQKHMAMKAILREVE